MCTCPSLPFKLKPDFSPRSLIFYVLLLAFSLIDQTRTRIRVNCNTGREYAAADKRWGTADPTVVSLELLTVSGAAPLAMLIVYQIVKDDPARYYWIIVLCTAELYGGYVATVPPFSAGGAHAKS